MRAPQGSACKSMTFPMSVEVEIPQCSETLFCPLKRMFTCPNDGNELGSDVPTASHQTGCPSASIVLHPSGSHDNKNAHLPLSKNGGPVSHEPNPPLAHTCQEQQAQTVPQSTREAHQNLGVATRDDCLIAHKNRIDSFWPEPTQAARKLYPKFCDVYSRIKATAKPNCFEAKIPLDSDLVIPAWREELVDYHDTMLCDYLEFGWPSGYHSDVSPDTTDKNHPSGQAYLSHISRFIEKELQHRAVIGPFHQDPFEPWVRYSPIMTRPKRDSDQRRVILDLSYPKGTAVNDGIAVENHFGQNISYTCRQ